MLCLVVYDAAGNARWASGTNGHQDSFVVMQDDGNLVIYNTAGRPVWASNTCQSGIYLQKYQNQSLNIACFLGR